MLRNGLVLIVVALLWGMGAVARAEEETTPTVRPEDLKKPQDYAPVEQRVTVRDPQAYRRKGGILSQAEHVPMILDEKVLYKRRLSMYEGTVFNDAMTDSVLRKPSGLVPAPLAAPTPTPNYVWVWVIAVATPIIIFIGFNIWWRSQMGHARAARAGLLLKHYHYVKQSRSPSRPASPTGSTGTKAAQRRSKPDKSHWTIVPRS